MKQILRQLAKRAGTIALSLALLVTLTPSFGFAPADVYAAEDIYRVTFNNGYSGNGSMEPVELTPEEAADYALPECTMDPLKNIDFTGWSIYDPTTGDPIEDDMYQPGDPYPVTRDIMLWANWKYDYTYHLRDTEDGSDETTIVVSYPRNNKSPDVLTDEDPRVVREGYKFQSWSNSPYYLNYPSYYSSSYWVHRDLYAFWYRHTVSTYAYSADGEGTGGTIKRSGDSYTWPDNRDNPTHLVYDGESQSNYTFIAAPANTETKRYRFVGWYKDGPDGELYSTETSITFNSYEVDEDLVLCAVFEEDEDAPLTLKMIANRGAQTIITQEVTKDENGDYTITVPDDPFSYNNDCYLKFWQAYETDSTGNNGTFIGDWYPGETRTLTRDTNLNAQWYFNITYHSMNGPDDDPMQGEDVTTKEYRLNQRPISYDDVPLKDSSHFDGWYKSPEYAAQGNIGYANLYDNKTQEVYAGYYKYRLDSYVEDNEMATGSITREGVGNMFPGDSMTLTATPGNRSVFKGWYENGRDGELFSTDNPLTVHTEDLDHDTKLYAVFDAAFEEPYVQIGDFPTSVCYQAKPIEPDPEVQITINGETKTLEKDKDYTVAYENNLNAGTAKVTFTGMGEYQGQIVKEFTITKLNVDTAGGAQPAKSTYLYTGAPIIPAITVAGYTMREGVDYMIFSETIRDNVNAGKNGSKASMYIRITDKNLTSSSTRVKIEFTIRPFNLLGEDGYQVKANMEGEEQGYNFPHTGEIVKPAITSIVCTPEDESLPAITLKEGDYTVTYTESTHAASKLAYINGTGNFYGQITLPFQVVPRNLEDAEITTDRTRYYYTGNKVVPTIIADGRTLQDGDYSTEIIGDPYGPSDEPVTLLLTGQGNYTGEPDPIVYKVERIDLSDPVVGAAATVRDLTYTGKPLTDITQGVTVKWPNSDEPFDPQESTDGTNGDYTKTIVDADGNEVGDLVDAGDYTLQFKGRGIYQGIYEVPFTVKKASQKVTISKSSYAKVYGNAAFSLGAKTDGDGTLTYTSSNTKVATVSNAAATRGKVTIKGVGKATITVYAKTGKNYKQSAKKTITITVKPKTRTISKVTAGSKKLTVKWTPLTTQATGYQVQVATNSGFTKGKKTVTVTSYKTGTATIKNLTAGKPYYVRIRTYKKVTVNGKTTMHR